VKVGHYVSRHRAAETFTASQRTATLQKTLNPDWQASCKSKVNISPYLYMRSFAALRSVRESESKPNHAA
jgi:hypothetical protein